MKLCLIPRRVRQWVGGARRALAALAAFRRRKTVRGEATGGAADGSDRAILHALEQERQLLRTLIDNLPDVVFAKDRQGRYIVGNRAKLAEVGVARHEDLVGRTAADFFPPDLVARIEDDEREIMANGQAVVHRREFLETRAGCRGWRVTTKVPLRNAAGEVTGMLGIARDITEVHHQQEENARVEAHLRQAQKMESIGRLAGGVAHDFNNMLQAILGYTQLAQQQTPPDGPLCDSLRHIEAVTRKAAEMTRKLLAFARRQPMQPRVLNLNGVIAGQLDLLRRLIGENIVLDWRPSADPWFVRMDPSQVDQILTNLAVNARDAIEGAGRIAVATANVTLDAAFAALHPGSRPGEYVELSVNDTGRGIPAEVLAHLFEPFYTTKSRGSGLGLATVYGIVKQNNGMIYGESEPGRGATFRVYFPRQTAEAPSAPSRIEVSDAAAPPPTGSETLLLVEDEEVVRHQTQALLARLGYVVLAAAASDEALRLMQLNAGMIDLLVSDVVMPEMNGRDLARRLTVVQPGLKCLFVSGYSDDVIAHHGVLDKDVHFLAKPFDMAALARKVREVLDG